MLAGVVRVPCRMGRMRLVIALVVATAGCGGSGSSGTSSDAGGPDARTEVPDGSYQISWGPITVPAGVEEVRCVTVRLGNSIPVNIHQIHNVLGPVSHHMILYKSPDTVEQTDPYPCDTIQNLIDETNGIPLMITQKEDETLVLPKGVAFAMDADQMMRIELHYVNASDTDQTVMVTSTLTPIPDAELEHVADLLFVGNPDIDLAPNSTGNLSTSFQPMPWELGDSKIFGITGHEHQWGTNVTVELASSETGPYQSIYDLPNFNWDEPETVYLDPPVSLVQGGGFRYSCNWFNGSTQRVRFGQGVNDEMCFFWAYYYPSKGPRTCFHTDQGSAPIDVCCPGDQLCNVIDQYF